jgi:drug/metabolite transporter (DMT)-like permease
MAGQSDTSPEAERILGELLRNMPFERKWRQMGVLYQTARSLHAAAFRARHPEASPEDIHADWQEQARLTRYPPPRGIVMPGHEEALPVIQHVVGTLDRLGVAYALSGSWASSFHGRIRFTHDADLCVEPFPGKEDAFCAAFGEDYYVSGDAVRIAVRQHRSFNVIHTLTAFKVDLFVLGSRLFDRSLIARRRAEALGPSAESIQLVSPEDVILLKLEWYRLGGKSSKTQWKDVLGVLQTQGSALDQAYLPRSSLPGPLGRSALGRRPPRPRPPGGTAVSPVAQGRLLVALAAAGWSTSGLFTKVLREDTPLGLGDPPVDPLQIAALRVLFAGLVLAPLDRRRDLSFRPATACTALSFAAMNATFVSAMALGSAANAILLQYTAPLWLVLAGAFLLGEPAGARGLVSTLAGLAGVGIIVAGGWEGGQLRVVLLGLASGLFYAGVVLGLRVLRGASPVWLTVVNNTFGGLVLLPWVWHLASPAPAQLGWLLLFAAVQTALPYWLMARGVRHVSAQEAGTITLLEPLLNPLWAYLISPATETPTVYTLAGGACILGALVYRYWPARAGAA